MTRFVLTVFTCFFLSALGAEAKNTWTFANEAYLKNDFQSAQSLYLECLKEGPSSAALYYNLGNTYYQLGDRGRALLNYERALAVDPSFQPAENNLAILADSGSINLISPQERWLRNHADLWLAVAAISFWMSIYAWLFLRNRKELLQPVLTATLILLAMSTFLRLLSGEGALAKDRALVVKRLAEVRTGPTRSSQVVESAGMGTEVRLLTARGEWSYCSLPTGRAGWTLSENVELLR